VQLSYGVDCYSEQKVVLPFVRIDVCRFDLISTRSLDHFIRSHQNLLRNRETDLLRSLEIDHQLKLRRLLDGKLGGLCAFQDLVHVRGCTAIDRNPRESITTLERMTVQPERDITFQLTHNDA
jgi:hypothetical protein